MDRLLGLCRIPKAPSTIAPVLELWPQENPIACRDIKPRLIMGTYQALPGRIKNEVSPLGQIEKAVLKGLDTIAEIGLIGWRRLFEKEKQAACRPEGDRRPCNGLNAEVFLHCDIWRGDSEELDDLRPQVAMSGGAHGVGRIPLFRHDHQRTTPSLSGLAAVVGPAMQSPEIQARDGLVPRQAGKDGASLRIKCPRPAVIREGMKRCKQERKNGSSADSFQWPSCKAESAPMQQRVSRGNALQASRPAFVAECASIPTCDQPSPLIGTVCALQS